MVQNSFFDQTGIAVIRHLSGASGGILVDWLNHGYYSAKPYTENRPYTLITEWLCADIATILDLRIPAREVIQFREEKLLGIEWRSNSVGFMPGMENKLTNANMIPGIFAFDILICNRDRHHNNILFQRPNPGADKYTCILIDHSHALIGNMQNKEAFERFIRNNQDPGAYIGSVPQQLKDLIVSMEDFDPWIDKIEALSHSDLQSSLAGIPSEWRPTPDESPELIDFIIFRKDNIRSLLSNSESYFRNMVKQEDRL